MFKYLSNCVAYFHRKDRKVNDAKGVWLVTVISTGRYFSPYATLTMIVSRQAVYHQGTRMYQRSHP